MDSRNQEMFQEIIKTAANPNVIKSGVGLIFGFMASFFGIFGVIALIIITTTGKISAAWIYVAVPIACIAFLIWCYNRALRLKNAVKSAYSQLDNDFQRRAELIPNLVESVKDALGYENETLKDIVRLRQKSEDSSLNEAQKINVEQKLSRSLMNVVALAESYPQLKATENIQSLKNLLTETENRIAQKRDVVSQSIEIYNSFVSSFPAVLIVKPFGFKEFEVPSLNESNELRKAPKVDLR
ncbi:MAG: LemA family protein [Holosporales bacterium]|jgi:LemA protein